MNPKQYVYIFIRGDLAITHQAVQAAHAALEAGRNLDPHLEHPSIIFLATRNKYELEQAQALATSVGLKTYPFHEPYQAWGLTAFACEPLSQAQRHLFSSYQLWRKQ